MTPLRIFVLGVAAACAAGLHGDCRGEGPTGPGRPAAAVRKAMSMNSGIRSAK